MQHIDIFLGRLGRLLALAASLCLVVMMLQICLDVGGRYLFGAPMPSTLEIVSDWWMPALIFLPLLNVEWRNENIAVDLFYQSRGARAQAVMDAVAYVCFGVFMALIAYAGFEQANSPARGGSESRSEHHRTMPSDSSLNHRGRRLLDWRAGHEDARTGGIS